RLETDHAPPAALAELLPRLRRREPVGEEVVVPREVDHADRSREAVVARLVERLHARMLPIGRAEDTVRLSLSVAPERLLDGDDRERLSALGPDERNLVGAADALQVLLRERERDGDRPRQPAGEMHALEDRAVVLLSLEPGERRERADREHLQVGELPRVDRELGEVARLLTCTVTLALRNEEVDER